MVCICVCVCFLLFGKDMDRCLMKFVQHVDGSPSGSRNVLKDFLFDKTTRTNPERIRSMILKLG